MKRKKLISFTLFLLGEEIRFYCLQKIVYRINLNMSLNIENNFYYWQKIKSYLVIYWDWKIWLKYLSRLWIDIFLSFKSVTMIRNMIWGVDMKSMKQIADMTGVSKMTVYRYIKANNITETSQKKQNFVIWWYICICYYKRIVRR